MKVTKIEIKDFHQFKDFTLDLTYPAGHEKAGQPLDKVCFIGQSGTGKTTLLETIPSLLYSNTTNFFSQVGYPAIKDNIYITFNFGDDQKYTAVMRITSVGNFFNRGMDLGGKYELSNDELVDYLIDEWQKGIISRLIYFPSNLSYDLTVEKVSTLNDAEIIDFSREKVSSVWNLILDQVQKYQEQELQIRQEISKTVESASNDLVVIKKALKNLEVWKESEFNPIKDIAEKCLNPLLANFKLRVKAELDIKSKDDIGFIKIEDFNKNEIPQGLWSTGTKQVVLSALPLYLLKPKNTIILFDEPERSLYPDLQRLIVDYYSSLADNCQFFYATHSPIIASSFEPWEIVELKFNSEGKVFRELYYEGENHVDNYKYNPRLMRWDDILQRIFDMENDGSPERKKKLDELASLNVKFKKLAKKGEDKTDEANGILKQIQKLREDLSYWD